MLERLKFKNQNIGNKYTLVLAIIISLFIISSIIVILQIENIGKNVSNLEDQADETANIIEIGSLIRGKVIRSISYSTTPTTIYLDEYQMLEEDIQELSIFIEDRLTNTEQISLYEEIIEHNTEMNTMFLDKIVSAINNNNIASARRTNSDLYSLGTEMITQADQLADLLKEEQRQSVRKANDSKEVTFIVLIASTLISIIVSIILVVFISRNISRNLNNIVTVSHLIAENDLSVEAIAYDGTDEIGQLATAMNTMKDNLRHMVLQLLDVSSTTSSQSEELTQAANEVMAGSEQISSTMQALASGTLTQADHTSELSRGMEDFSSKIKNANDNGRTIQEASENVYQMTTEGSRLMEKSTNQMSRIDEIMRDAVVNVQSLDTQSQQISELVSVIQSIASQTNLLALNAAIEAARAGEHGKGFAVVADEVRKLAEDVSVSVTDITGIVGNIQQESTQMTESLQIGYEEVEQGISQIQETTETFTQISSAIETMVQNIRIVIDNLVDASNDSDMMLGGIQEISAVAEESSAGIEQTSASSQQTNSSMEEVTASSEDLARLAEELNDLIKQFKL